MNLHRGGHSQLKGPPYEPSKIPLPIVQSILVQKLYGCIWSNYFIVMARYLKSLCPYICICAKRWSFTIKGPFYGPFKINGLSSRLLCAKAVGLYIEPLLHNSGPKFEEPFSIVMVLREEVVIDN